MAFDAGNAARDALHITVGAAALAIQKLMVLRRDVEARFEADDGSTAEMVDAFEARIVEVERRVDAALESVQDQLPVPAQLVVAGFRESARETRRLLRSMIAPAGGATGSGTD